MSIILSMLFSQKKKKKENLLPPYSELFIDLFAYLFIFSSKILLPDTFEISSYKPSRNTTVVTQN